MARRYCAVDDVKKFLPEGIVPEGENPTPNPRNPDPETLLTADVEFFIERASDLVDASLSTIYQVPIKKVMLGGTVQYPGQIPHICAILASQMIYEQRLQQSDRGRSEAQKEREQWAMNELKLIQNGERVLWGIHNLKSSRFVRNTLYGVPKNPASDNKSEGQS